MITIRDISFAYQEKNVLENLSIEFEDSQIHGIVGLNGSGKTTFFNLLVGYLSPDKGTILQQDKPLLKQSIAYIDTESFFYPKLTANEFLSVFKQTNTAYNEQELANLFDLPLEGFVENYSTGMKKKLLILSQLKQDKQIYVFDEPFNGLDLESNKSLQIIIQLLSKKKKTIFIASHIIEPLFTICDKIHHLKNMHFEKTFLPQEYNQLEEAVFGHMTDKIKQTLEQSI